MQTQYLYDKIIGHLRAQGNPWGTIGQRQWSYVNPQNPCERCAKGIFLNTFQTRDGKYAADLSYNDHAANEAIADAIAEQGRSLPIQLDSCAAAICQAQKINLTLDEVVLLNELEYIFECKNPNNWENEFQKLAIVNNLDYTKPMKQENSIEVSLKDYLRTEINND